jgi:hypothetical protein
MDEYHAFEAIYTMRGIAAQDGMNFFTILSAYLVVAYVAGSKLSAFQVWGISILYSLFSLGPIMAMHISVVDMHPLPYAKAHSVWSNGAASLSTVMGLMWVLSIVFTIDARRRSR